MSFPPPPPMMTSKRKGHEPIRSTDDNRKCYEKSRISKEEAIIQIQQIAMVELESLVRSDAAVGVGEKPLGMLIIMNPILEPILQLGPVCGLIALVEAAQILKSEVGADAVFAEARRRGLTKNGEIFSVESMQTLIKEHLRCESKILNTSDIDTFKELVKSCLQGKPALIPYDADYNHGPSLRKGHAAHWAVIHGVAIPIYVSNFKELMTAGYTNGDVAILEPQHLTHFPELEGNIFDLFSTNLSYVIAHQGKSIRTAIWKYSALIQSNQNLHEISPKLTSNSQDYVLGNIEHELCSKIVILE